RTPLYGIAPHPPRPGMASPNRFRTRSRAGLRGSARRAGRDPSISSRAATIGWEVRGKAEEVEKLPDVVVGKLGHDRLAGARGVARLDRAGEGAKVLAGALDQRGPARGPVSGVDCLDSTIVDELLELVEA